ncbi:MAG: hypothetical protein ACRDTM_09245 [Micromonosporaceae bacterium]
MLVGDVNLLRHLGPRGTFNVLDEAPEEAELGFAEPVNHQIVPADHLSLRTYQPADVFTERCSPPGRRRGR